MVPIPFLLCKVSDELHNLNCKVRFACGLAATHINYQHNLQVLTERKLGPASQHCYSLLQVLALSGTVSLSIRLFVSSSVLTLPSQVWSLIG